MRALLRGLCFIYLLVFALVGCLTIGCGGSTGGRVSGKVTFKGQPVPSGTVYILPDSSKGNSGATGFANISNGTYDTSEAGGRGAPKGAVILRVEGIDPTPPPGASPDVTTTLLFSQYDKAVELTGDGDVQDIDVPAEAANAPPASEAPQVIVP